MQDVESYGVGATYNGPTNFSTRSNNLPQKSYTLDTPALNISVNRWTAIYESRGYQLGAKGVLEDTWGRANKTVGIDYINDNDHTKCQSLGVGNYSVTLKETYLLTCH